MPVSNQQIQNWLTKNPNATNDQILAAMNKHGVTPEQFSKATWSSAPVAGSPFQYGSKITDASSLGNWFQDSFMDDQQLDSGELIAALRGAQSSGLSPDQFFGSAQGIFDPSMITDQINTELPNTWARWMETGVNPDTLTAQNMQDFQQANPQKFTNTTPALAQLQPQGGGAAAQPTTATPQYGLSGLEGAYQTGIDQLSPYQQTGAAANTRLADYLGLGGPEAQATAFQNFQSSPYTDQVRKNAERAILQNASATGSVGSGNTLDQLYQNAAGLFLDDFYTQGLGLSDMANRGFGAATNAAGMYSNLGGARYQAGRDVSGNIGGITSGLSSLVNQQGAGISDLVGNTANNVNNLLQSAYGGDANAKMQLMQLLSNLATQSGSQVGSLPIIPGYQSNYLGQAGQIASGIGGLLGGINAANTAGAA